MALFGFGDCSTILGNGPLRECLPNSISDHKRCMTCIMTSHTRIQNDSFSLLADSIVCTKLYRVVQGDLQLDYQKKPHTITTGSRHGSLRFNYFGSLTPPYGSMSERFRKQAHIQDENFGPVSQALEPFSKLCIFLEPIVLNQEHSERLN